MRDTPASLQPKWLNPQLPREGRYVLGPLLGKGGMGEVMEAWDVVLCRTVALKYLKYMEPPAMIRFMHEAQVQARVVHPNICRIYDIESSEGTLKIAMQLIKGPNLEQAARQLNVDEVVHVLCQVAEAVHAAHRVNLIHRDLKPSNIILERSPEGRWVPYLVDFGLAVAVGEPAMTLSQAVIGTPAFMAPEQTRGDRDAISPATDVYALGGTLHYALLGYPPGSTDRTTTRPRPGLPPDLDTIIRTCLEEEPERRYPSALALAEDLWRFRNGEPIQAQRPRAWRWRPRLPRRGRRVVWFCAAAALAAASLSAHLAWSLRQQRLGTLAASRLRLEAEEAVDAYRSQENLPVHDLRPARARLQEQARLFGERTAHPTPEGRAAAWLAQGQCALALGHYRTAAALLARAGQEGLQDRLLRVSTARAKAGLLCWEPELDEDGPASLDPAAGAFQEEGGRWNAAVGHLLVRDFAAASADARIALEMDPSLHEPPGLEGAALAASARQRYRAGDLAGARSRFLEAAETTRKLVQVWESCVQLRRAQARARLWAAETTLDLGESATAQLLELERDTRQALQLEPDSAPLREDWLLARWCLARSQLRDGRDPRPLLEPLTGDNPAEDAEDPHHGLRAASMLVNAQVAEAAEAWGDDPGPALVEALRIEAPSRHCLRDYAGDLLLLKARLEAARGQDPRPTLERVQTRLQPALARSGWPALETAAAAAYLRAEWESRKGLDASGAIAQVRDLVDQALAIQPNAQLGNGLAALALALEAQRTPGRGSLLLPAAREHLRRLRPPTWNTWLGPRLRRAGLGRS